MAPDQPDPCSPVPHSPIPCSPVPLRAVAPGSSVPSGSRPGGPRLAHRPCWARQLLHTARAMRPHGMHTRHARATWPSAQPTPTSQAAPTISPVSPSCGPPASTVASQPASEGVPASTVPTQILGPETCCRERTHCRYGGSRTGGREEGTVP